MNLSPGHPSADADDSLERCFARARRAQEGVPLPEAAPLGFASRVLAQCRATEGQAAAGAGARDWTLWLLPRAIGVAAVACVVAMQASWLAPVEEPELGSLVMNLALGEKP